jgi:hypothetical protein
MSKRREKLLGGWVSMRLPDGSVDTISREQYDDILEGVMRSLEASGEITDTGKRKRSKITGKMQVVWKSNLYRPH